MNKITYKNIIKALLAEFPEYKESKKYFDELNTDLPYIVLGNLCLMAFEDIDRKKNIKLAEKLVRFADRILNNLSSEEKLINLFTVEVLEHIVGSGVGAELAKKYLHNKSLELLELVIKDSNCEEFLNKYRKD